MTAAHSKPILGAALMSKNLPQHRDWIFEHNRDLELQDFFQGETLDGDWRPLAAQIKQMLDGYKGRLGIHGPFWGFTIDSEDALIRSVVTKRLLQGLETAEAVGATQMVVHSPYTTWDYNNFDNNVAAREGVIERAHLTMKAVVKRAEDIGCELVLENIEDKDPTSRVELARSFGSANVKVSIDTGHAHYAHGSTGAPPVDYYVVAAGDALAHVHLQDADGYADRHWHPGEGTIRWEAVFRALARFTSNPRLVLEVKDQPGLMKGAAHLVGLGLAL